MSCYVRSQLFLAETGVFSPLIAAARVRCVRIGGLSFGDRAAQEMTHISQLPPSFYRFEV